MGDSDEQYERTDTSDLFMVVTLKSGTQLRIQVEEFRVGKSPLEGLVSLKWTGSTDAENTLKYLDLGEVVGVHAERPRSS